jgi:hypothetical protein
MVAKQSNDFLAVLEDKSKFEGKQQTKINLIF